MKYYSLVGQMLQHFPSLLFLLLLVATVFILPDEEILPPIDNETTARDIVWSRHTAEGEVIRLRAPILVRKVNGVVNMKNVRIDAAQRDSSFYLQGATGTTDNQYQQILMQETAGEIINPDGRIELSLASAQYALSGAHRLEGSDVNITKENSWFSGDSFLWENKKLLLSGNVRATYRPAAPASAEKDSH